MPIFLLSICIARLHYQCVQMSSSSLLDDNTLAHNWAVYVISLRYIHHSPDVVPQINIVGTTISGVNNL